MTDVGKPEQPELPEVVDASYGDTHTAENTTMRHKQQPKSPIVRELTEEEIRDSGYLTIKLGGSLEENRALYKDLVGNWLRYAGVVQGYDESRYDEARLTKATLDWETYCKENYPGKTKEEVADEASMIYSFTSLLLDDSSLRVAITSEEGISNTANRGSGHVTPDIVGKVPDRSTAGFSPSQIMMRASISADKDKLNFDVLLRDSFVMLTFTRPSRLEMGNLYNDIKNTIAGYVREIHYNLPVVARVAIAKVLWNFVSKRIVYSSVSDTTDFVSLAKVIKLNDLSRITIALLESYNTKGVNLHLSCLTPKCDWGSYALVDPTLLLHNRNVSTDAELATYANLFNGRSKYTIEETLALSDKLLFGMKAEENRVYNEDRSIYLEINQPTLAQAFNTFDYFVSQINPRIAEIKATTIDPDEFEERMTMLYNDIGSTEFIHWISGFHRVPSPDSDEQPIALLRNEVDNEVDFNKGLISVLSESNSLNKGLIKYIVTKAPLMSNHFIGVQNFICPSCSKEQGSIKDETGHSRGYTPVDPYMSFFTLTQLKILSQTQDMVNHRDEVLSN